MEIMEIDVERRPPKQERSLSGFILKKKAKLSASGPFNSMAEAFKATLQTPLEYDDEEWMGQLQRAIRLHPEANSFIGSDKQLLHFVGTFFKDWVIDIVISRILTAKGSWLGSSYARRGTLGTYTHSLLYFVGARLGEMVKMGTEGTPEGTPTDAESSGQGRPDGAGAGGAQADHEEPNGGLEGTAGGEQQKEQKDSKEKSPPPGEDEKEAERAHFKNVPVHNVVLKGEFVPPPYIKKMKGSLQNQIGIRDRKERIEERSMQFCDDPYVNSNYPVTANYRPDDDVEQPEYVHVYHGTRSSSLKDFFKNGILPGGNLTDFSRFNTFYLGNSVRLAFEHVLIQKEGEDRPRETEQRDTVAVLVFRVPVRVIRGLQPIAPGEKRLNCKHFDSRDIGYEGGEWRDFCKKNLELDRPGKVRFSHPYDIVSGPIAVGGEGEARRTNPQPFRVATKSPLQIAACTKTSCAYLEPFLVDILREKRIETVHVDPTDLAEWPPLG